MKNVTIITLSFLCLFACKENPKSNDNHVTADLEATQNVHNTEQLPPVHSATPESEYSEEEMTTVDFPTTTFDFGKISKQGGKVNHYFTFTNTGNKPLIVNVKPGCGCTLGYSPNEPILPGKKDSIKLEFNPITFGGQKVTKSATVTGNIKDKVMLHFTADVSE